jgi:hypothetical protein
MLSASTNKVCGLSYRDHLLTSADTDGLANREQSSSYWWQAPLAVVGGWVVVVPLTVQAGSVDIPPATRASWWSGSGVRLLIVSLFSTSFRVAVVFFIDLVLLSMEMRHPQSFA